MSVNVNSEYAKLKKVVIGILNNDELNNMTPVNDVFRSNYSKGSYPKKEEIENEFENYIKNLELNDIEIIRPERIKDNSNINNQLYTRDLGFVIGNKFFISPLTLPIRKGEINGIISLIKEYKYDIIHIPKDLDINIEGGDVFVDNTDVYIGIGPRTNMNGYNFIKNSLKDKYNVQYIEHTCVHLDCCFNILDKNVILVCKPFISDKDNEKMENIYKKYESIVEVSIYESNMMMTNILSIGNKTLLVNNSEQNIRLNNIFKLLDFNLIEVSFNNANLLGGSFRCASLPLIRA